MEAGRGASLQTSNELHQISGTCNFSARTGKYCSDHI
jgi:hypothetical protein